MNCDRKHKESSEHKSLSHIVGLYKKEYAPGAEQEMRYYKIQKKIENVIEKAALSKLPPTKQYPSGKRHPHQRRIPGNQLIAAKDALLKEKGKLKNCKNFHELFKMVCACIGCVDKIGELTIYDISHRIGAHLGLKPDQVYLHAGTRVGAKALKIKLEKQALSMSQLPKPFHALKPHEIEDCLCIFKKKIAAIGI